MSVINLNYVALVFKILHENLSNILHAKLSKKVVESAATFNSNPLQK